MTQGFIIAIDGPVASGKGTIAPLVAKKLGFFYLDTGIFYRCLSLFCIWQQIDFVDTQAVISAMRHVRIVFEDTKIFLNTKNVTQDIRSVEVSNGSGKVAAIDEVQKEMIQRQREVALAQLSHGQGVVVEGRNIGTGTFPDAPCKIYLTACVSVRAQRRLQQLRQKGETQLTLAEVEDDVKARDERDMNRKTFPLVRDPEIFGYTILDDSDLTEEQTLEKILNIVQSKTHI